MEVVDMEEIFCALFMTWVFFDFILPLFLWAGLQVYKGLVGFSNEPRAIEEAKNFLINSRRWPWLPSMG